MARKRLSWNKDRRELILNRDNRTCIYCGAKKRLSLDHVVPIKLDGSDRADNIVTSCKTCNSTKNGNRLLPNYEQYILDVVSDRNDKFGIDGELIVTARKGRNGKRNRKKSEISKRDRARERWIRKRMSNLTDVQLYYIRLFDKRDANRLRSSCSYHGYEHLSIPLDECGNKFAIVNGKVKGSVPISFDEAMQKMVDSSRFISPKREIRIGGRLGSVCKTE